MATLNPNILVLFAQPNPDAAYAWGLEQITMTRPRRRITRHLSHILRTDATDFHAQLALDYRIAILAN